MIFLIFIIGSQFPIYSIIRYSFVVDCFLLTSLILANFFMDIISSFHCHIFLVLTIIVRMNFLKAIIKQIELS
jgi:hypothetical protein